MMREVRLSFIVVAHSNPSAEKYAPERSPNKYAGPRALALFLAEVQRCPPSKIPHHDNGLRGFPQKPARTLQNGIPLSIA
jgi:hypothetical protein